MHFTDDLRACGFATGLARSSDNLPGRVSAAHMVLTIRIGGIITTQAILDTGSPWCILNPDMVAILGDLVEETYVPTESLVIRRIHYQGRFARVAIRLLVGAGTDLDVEATAWVPILSVGAAWDVLDFIGLEDFLQVVRFAVDPRENMRYVAGS